MLVGLVVDAVVRMHTVYRLIDTIRRLDRIT